MLGRVQRFSRWNLMIVFTQLEVTFLQASCGPLNVRRWRRALGDSGTCQKIGAPFFTARREPHVHICCSNPGRVDEHVAHTHTRVHARRYAYYSAACGPNLTKSDQMSISNVAQVGAACRRKPTRCICASRVRIRMNSYMRACVRVTHMILVRFALYRISRACWCFAGGIAPSLPNF